MSVPKPTRKKRGHRPERVKFKEACPLEETEQIKLAQWLDEMKTRIEEKIERVTESGCWIWMASTNGKYGRMKRIRERKTDYAHRISWEVANSKAVPIGLQILHTCDNPLCVNPYHLYAGTQKQNIEDAISRNRFVMPPKLIGALHWNVKLSEADVLQIREDKRSAEKIAEHYKISERNVWNIKKRLSWQHV